MRGGGRPSGGGDRSQRRDKQIIGERRDIQRGGEESGGGQLAGARE